jgi:CheY-like chemotaxis protein
MSSPLQRPFVLLVEDSEDDAFFFRWTLHKCGLDCDLVHAADGEAAVRHLEECLKGTKPCPDLVFLDLKMPTMTGFEVLTWIRSRSFGRPLDVAVLSGSEHASDVERATALGASAYYVKPISVELLRARFAAWHQKQSGQSRTEPVEAHACAAPDVSA